MCRSRGSHHDAIRLPSQRSSGQATLARGATIGRYVVLGLVGRGGMGEVYAAYDPELDRKVAVKLLRVKPGAGVSLAEGRQRTLREAQAIARLSHPNVVVVYDVGTFSDQVFIAMEFVEGNTVTYWVQAQARSWQEVLKVFMAAGRGLAAAHEKGLVHRDFKPDNVMVGRDGQVRVMDFGLARQVTEKSARRRADASATSGRRRRRRRQLPLRDRRSGMRRRRQTHGDRRRRAHRDRRAAPEPARRPSETHAASTGMFEAQLTRTGRDDGDARVHGARAVPGRRRPTRAPISSASASRSTRRSTASARSAATRCSR